ncbi:MAG TPA: hypothetical protein EYO59_05400, partial [Chromatiaceae bacterium]|nr:hypothetical protein [Chromatiaceae bacterium]
MQQFRQFVFTPPGCDDPSLAIAGSRADGICVFNAEYHRSAESIESALAHLATHAHGEFGVRVGSFATKPFFTQLTQYLPRGLAWVIVDPAMAKKQAKWIDGYRADGGQIVVEIMDWDDKLPKSLPALDGWMVKGHEAGGRVGEETTFILLQKALDELDVPVYAHGGIGMHTSAACYAAGAAGVVLDNQLLLLQESPLADTLRVFIGKLVGNETITLGDPGDGEYYRILERPGLLKAKSIREKSHTQSLKDIATAVIDHTNWEFPQDGVLPMGQDVAFAAPWAERFVTVGGVLGAMRDSLSVHLQQAHEFNPLAAGSPLAVSHGTTYPIVQGPMTRVSDTAGFAAGVAEGGGLPMLGLALMRPEGVRKLLEETKEKIKGKPWGVGLLGFAPAELFNAQLAVAREFKPEFALIAGGRPDQALDLEREGVPSYLHVPSPRLLSMFIEQGARRFVFEGRECGGHIGPLASFVLWESMVDTLLAEVTDPKIAQDLHLLFAGGIHDARSAAMVATMTAPLAAMGMQIGVLMGTAYLFTKEIVAGGGIVANFQKQAIKCTRTVGLETGVGHSSRCSDTGFAQEFLATKRKMLADGCSPDEIRDALEDLNLGRL